MPKVDIKVLDKFIFESLISVGLSELHANWIREVNIRATLRGAGHHDINNYPDRLDSLIEGKINVVPEIQLINSFEAMECYDGNNGPGEVCSTFIMERCKLLADQHGIGFCTIINSNHFLAAAPYVEKAAEEGYLAILYTRGSPLMGAPNRKERVISACPMGFAAPSSKEYSFMMDMCLTYASGELLEAKIKAGEKVPPYWGVDVNGNATSDPDLIKNGGTRAPIGGHKGFALSMLAEIFTGILSGGQVIDEPSPLTGRTGTASQAAIIFKLQGLMPLDHFKQRVTDMIDRIEARAQGIHIPGQGSYHSKVNINREQQITLEANLIERLNKQAEKLGINTL